MLFVLHIWNSNRTHILHGNQRTAATKFPNPTITIANVLSVFKLAVGSVNFEELSGFRVIRRTTLRKYLKSINLQYKIQCLASYKHQDLCKLHC